MQVHDICLIVLPLPSDTEKSGRNCFAASHCSLYVLIGYSWEKAAMRHMQATMAAGLSTEIAGFAQGCGAGPLVRTAYSVDPASGGLAGGLVSARLLLTPAIAP